MSEDTAPPKDDPYEDEPPRVYECVDCENRIETENQPVECPECGGEMRDISSPSER